MVLLIAALLLRAAAGAGRRRSRSLRAPGARAVTGAVPHVAVMELSAARARAIGDRGDRRDRGVRRVAIQGAHGDLLQGPGKRGARR